MKKALWLCIMNVVVQINGALNLQLPFESCYGKLDDSLEGVCCNLVLREG